MKISIGKLEALPDQKLDLNKEHDDPYEHLTWPAMFCYSCKQEAVALKIVRDDHRDCQCNKCGAIFGNHSVDEDGKLLSMSYDEVRELDRKRRN